ncbi:MULTISPECIES: helicase-related protein [Bacteroides]|uniref:helicase-related protein n=2 Tax=Bacteroidales TaxID=171549 RepID=UPI00265ACE3D|nr:helicase-related protein [Bacteroides congonensis]
MDGQFITNKDLILSDIINSILPKCDNAYFLVGYFYFSGFVELCEKLKNVNLKVLVGLEVERNIINGIKEVENFTTSNKSRGQLREEFYKGFVDIYNNTDFFDSEEQIEKFRLFLEKIENGTLEVKKTSDPNHAKLYLFQNREEENVCSTFPGTMITGSSNFSVAGLKNRLELNVILRDKPSYVEGKSVFDELWDTAVTIVDEEHIADFKEKVIKHIWFEKLYSPYAMFIRVLHEYFNITTDENILTPSDITDGTYSDLKYQTDAVQLALNSIKNHEGVIISDVVGLGKSIIASTVARNLRLRTIIICPPHLKQQWEEYKDEFGFTASVFSTGKVEAALNHYRMIARPDEKFLIIVDEAHKYKNEFILDYSILHDLCMSNKVMLLTATPFNNRPEDIYSMLKLFQIPSKSTLKTVENLSAAFKDLISRYKDLAEGQRKNILSKSEIKSEADSIAQNIRSIISPLVVRRSRLDLEEIPEYKEDLKRQHINPVIPESPVQLGYYLGDIRELYLRTLNLISPTDEEKRNNPGFHYYEGARYKPTAYIVDDEKSKKELDRELEEKMGTDLGMLIGRQVNVSLFMRRMLVRRYESSVAAFRDSLNSMIDSSEHILKWIEKRDKVPVYKKGTLPDVDEFYETTADDLSEEITDVFEKYQERGFFEIDMKYIKREEFLNDIQADLQLLKDIRKEWFKPQKKTVKGKSVTTYDMKFDYKLDAFRKLLKEQRMADPARKIIVFTEFADTANYLGAALENEGLGVFKYTSKEASSTNKSIIRANFDAGLKPQYQKDDYQILIATDAISEGYNLHRAGTIFNYDIPYNPTRVIQRIGRINRINKKMFDKLYIYNYFPTDIGEAETRTKQISTLKMAMIHAIMGEDTKALTDEEELNAFFKERYQAELAKSEERSWDTKYRNLLNKVKGTDVHSIALQIPHRARIAREVKKACKGIILFGKKGNDFVFKIGMNNTDIPLMLTSEQALNLFEATTEEEPVAVDKQFDEIYQHVKSHLYRSIAKDENEKSRLEAFDKLKLWLKTKALPKDYLNDLLMILQNDGLTGEEVRFINKQTSKTTDKVMEKITQDYLNRIVDKMNKVEEGDETLILAEQIR